MPIYEYRCAACGHEVEALQKLTDAPLTDCPSCHKAELRKLVSAAGFQLKGSGWYVTDFRNNGAKPAAKDKVTPNGNGQAAGSAEAGSKTDTPAEKPATPAADTKTTPAPASSARSED